MNPETIMQLALRQAERGRGRVEPNPMVAALVVADQARIVAEGYHERCGGPHAEVIALERAGERARGAELYVTLEPCAHHGKTPPCTEAIRRAGIRRVFYGARDPNPQTAGKGPAELQAAGIPVRGGVLGAACRALNAPYEKLITRGLPWVTCKWAMSLDGRIAPDAGSSRWITGEEARRRVHQERDRADAVLVGVGTALADDPRLDCRLPGGRNPLRIVLDSRARLPLEAHLAVRARELPTWVAVTGEAPAERVRALEATGLHVVRVNDRPPLAIDSLLRLLGEERMTHLLVEGGARVHGSFFDGGHVDRVLAFIAPQVLGGAEGRPALSGLAGLTLEAARRLRRVKLETLGEDLLIEAHTAPAEAGT